MENTETEGKIAQRKEFINRLNKILEYRSKNESIKYLFIILEVQDGEHCHTHKVLHTTRCKSIEFAAQYYAAHFWGYSGNVGSKNHPKWEVEQGYPIIEVRKIEQVDKESFNNLSKLFSY